MLSGTFSLSLEGFTSKNIPLNNLNNDILKNVLQDSFPRIGNVNIKNETRIEFNEYDNKEYEISVYTIDFISREDNVPEIIINTKNITNKNIRDKIFFKTIINGGSKTLIPNKQNYNIQYNNLTRSIQKISISVPEFIPEKQKISLISDMPIFGFFSLNYGNFKTEKSYNPRKTKRN